MDRPLKPLVWIRSSRKDLKAFPASVRDIMGYALFLAQAGDKHVAAKPMKGFGPGVVEIVEDFDRDTYRAVYTVRFADAVYVLHAFQKKSKRGARTSKSDLDLIRRRLKDVEADRQAQTRKG